jgi:hypothetical protein
VQWRQVVGWAAFVLVAFLLVALFVHFLPTR